VFIASVCKHIPKSINPNPPTVRPRSARRATSRPSLSRAFAIEVRRRRSIVTRARFGRHRSCFFCVPFLRHPPSTPNRRAHETRRTRAMARARRRMIAARRDRTLSGEYSAFARVARDARDALGGDDARDEGFISRARYFARARARGRSFATVGEDARSRRPRSRATSTSSARALGLGEGDSERRARARARARATDDGTRARTKHRAQREIES